MHSLWSVLPTSILKFTILTIISLVTILCCFLKVSAVSKEAVMLISDPEMQVQCLTVRLRIKDTTRNAFLAYRRVAWGADELMPLSQEGSSLIGNSGATIIDSLDSLFIMGLQDEYLLARAWVQEFYHPQEIASYVSVFETTIRALGGLLAIYDLTADHMFLEKAKQIGEIILDAFGAEVLPTPSYNPYQQSMGARRDFCLAEVGSITVELERLGSIVSDLKYRQKIDQLLRVIAKRKGTAQSQKWNGLFPVELDSHGVFRGHIASFTGQSDSFYEYLIKLHFLRHSNDHSSPELRMFQDAIAGMLRHLLGRYGPDNNGYFLGKWNMDTGRLSDSMDHLACFTPGMLIMALRRGALDTFIGGYNVLHVAEGLGEACWQMYAASANGLAGEATRFDRRGAHPIIGSRWYIQRPEAVESFWYLFRFTGERKWQEYGTRIFDKIESHCAVHGGLWGYSGLDDNGDKDNKQQSFFIAETLKYLYLLHSLSPTLGETDFMDTTKWVLNTEAHPLRVNKVETKAAPTESWILFED